MDRDHTRLLSQTETLNYLESRPEISGNIKLDFADFIVQEDLGFLFINSLNLKYYKT